MFQCQSVTQESWSKDVRKYVFQASYDESIPEHQRFAKYTPSGRLEITVDRPEISYDLGEYYYLDISPVANRGME
jgi:hypothetical protein